MTLTPFLLRSYVWLYPRIIVFKSHGDTSMYVDTVVNLVKLTTYIHMLHTHTTLTPIPVYLFHSWHQCTLLDSYMYIHWFHLHIQHHWDMDQESTHLYLWQIRKWIKFITEQLFDIWLVNMGATLIHMGIWSDILEFVEKVYLCLW